MVVKQCDSQICDLHIESEGYNSKKVAAKRKLELSQSAAVSTGVVTPNKYNRVDGGVTSIAEPRVKVPTPEPVWSQPKSSKIQSSPQSVEQIDDYDSDFCDEQMGRVEETLKMLKMEAAPISALTVFSTK